MKIFREELRCWTTWLLWLLTAMASIQTIHAEVQLACPFQDHMVLQGSDHVPVWGQASPGETIVVTMGDRSARTQADESGRWEAKLDLRNHSGGPFTLLVEGSTRILLSDVLVGEVWLAGGQSNMEFQLERSSGGAEEIAQSANTQIRQFLVKTVSAEHPASTCSGKWVAADPSTSGKFTAVGYYFAKELQHAFHRPVGLLSSYYGGSDIEAWMSQETIDTLPAIKGPADRMEEEVRTYSQRLQQYQKAYAAWELRYSRADAKDWNPILQEKGNVTEGWRPIQMKGTYAQASLKDGGVIWLRETVKITTDMLGSYLPLHLGTIHDFDHVYWNGVEIGSTTPAKSTNQIDQAESTLARRYDVPAKLLRAGDAQLAIRIFNPTAAPSVDGGELPAGLWMARVESSEKPLSFEAKAAMPQRPPTLPAERFRAGVLYNAMISPLVPYAIRGVIWYQGESNTERAYQYRSSFIALIQDWRKQWGEGKFPFYFCQLANVGSKDKEPRDSSLAELREAQTMALSLPNTGEAITLDVGEESDIHYRDKKTVGLRLARIALAKTYGARISYSGPVPSSTERSGSDLVIHFRFADAGLKAVPLPATYKKKSTLEAGVPLLRNSPGSELEGFAICGSDHEWVWADARIRGDTVIVSSRLVEEPVAVRYAWGGNPTANLYNGAGLPAGPFRTDNLLAITRNSTF